MSDSPIASSFRDPSGFVFRRDGQVLRQINLAYKADYDCLLASGLYADLTAGGLLVSHEEADDEAPATPTGAYRIIRPEMIPFISYPYEWSFSQLKDAALTTLQIQRRCLDHGMSLKDCSAYNVQFRSGRPVFIDTLSFERYRAGEPWVAYRQFCQQFLAPLALMSLVDVRLGHLLTAHIDGLPLDLVSRLLPLRTRLRPSLLLHVHIHAKSQRRYAAGTVGKPSRSMSLLALRGLVDSLERAVKGLVWRPRGTQWADYYSTSSYSSEAMRSKQDIVSRYLAATSPQSVWDLGANTGVFSRLAAQRGAFTVAFDSDPAAVEQNYLDCRRTGNRNLLPLLADLTNPSPAIGWANEERPSLLRRGQPDAVLALALVHHLAIANNLPLARLAAFLSRVCRFLIIEFVPRTDSQVQRLLATREDIFADYTQEAFEAEFGRLFTLRDSARVTGSERTLYLMEKGHSGT
jgi:ribosomal protein L11 methylase PrmA